MNVYTLIVFHQRLEPPFRVKSGTRTPRLLSSYGEEFETGVYPEGEHWYFTDSRSFYSRVSRLFILIIRKRIKEGPWTGFTVFQ